VGGVGFLGHIGLLLQALFDGGVQIGQAQTLLRRLVLDVDEQLSITRLDVDCCHCNWFGWEKGEMSRV
jgi:hypothetical protein